MSSPLRNISFLSKSLNLIGCYDNRNAKIAKNVQKSSSQNHKGGEAENHVRSESEPTAVRKWLEVKTSNHSAMLAPGEISRYGRLCIDNTTHMGTNVLFLTFDNEFLGIIYSLFGGRQNIFLTMFSTKLVKCAAKILKID